MKIRSIKTSFVCVFMLFTCFAWSQDQIIETKLKNHNALRDAIYSDNGLWIVGEKPVLTIRSYKSNFSIHKFTADLSEKEWEVDVKGDNKNTGLIYNPDDPTYVYIRSDAIQGSKKFIIQISPDGKETIKNIPKDEILEDDLFYFCDSNYYYEVWSKKKSPDLAIIKYEHATLKSSRLNVKMPPLPKRTRTYEQWAYSGKTDTTFVLLSYDTEDLEKKIDILTVNIFSGETKQLSYAPNLDNINISPSANIRFFDGAVSSGLWSSDITTTYNNNNFKWSSYGNIIPERNGEGFYFYALGSFSEKREKDPKPEGFIVTKLDKNAREVWSKKVTIKEDEVDNTFYKNPRVPGAMQMTFKYLEEDDALSLETTYNKTDVIGPFGSVEIGLIGYKFDTDGNLVDKCSKNFSQKVLFSKGPQAMNNIDILPCFSSEKAQKVVDYINNKGETGTYFFFRNKDSYILVINSEGDKELYRCVYFAN